jgi:hypothetical protein
MSDLQAIADRVEPAGQRGALTPGAVLPAPARTTTRNL